MPWGLPIRRKPQPEPRPDWQDAVVTVLRALTVRADEGPPRLKQKLREDGRGMSGKTGKKRDRRERERIGEDIMKDEKDLLGRRQAGEEK